MTPTPAGFLAFPTLIAFPSKLRTVACLTRAQAHHHAPGITVAGLRRTCTVFPFPPQGGAPESTPKPSKNDGKNITQASGNFKEKVQAPCIFLRRKPDYARYRLQELMRGSSASMELCPRWRRLMNVIARPETGGRTREKKFRRLDRGCACGLSLPFLPPWSSLVFARAN